MHYIAYFDSPLGQISLAASDRGLTRLWFTQQQENDNSLENNFIQLGLQWLEQYFSFKRPTVCVPLDPTGTPFQRQVWQTLMTIPLGFTCSYASIAQKLGNPAAVRAVGSANGKNPIALLIPCHRVIGADGSLTGYAGGKDRKLQLLLHEQILLNQTSEHRH